MPDKRLFLLDAMALVYRAYYALMSSPRYTSDGKNTNAQFGFTTTLYDLINKEKPSHLAVVWDTFAPTERHIEYKEYKANRQATPEDLLKAIPDIKRIIEGFNIPCLELDGYEADDIIGTLALEAADKGYTVYMVTPDKDYGQIVRENVFIYKPGYKGGTFEIIGEKEVCEKWNIKSVHQVIDILGLMGDAVDNIPGIPGVGEKTAAKLLAEYDNVENILANAENIKGKLGEKIRDGKEKAILSKRLATIITNVPIDFHEEQFLLSEWKKPELEAIFAELEFRALTKRILHDATSFNETAPVSAQGDLFNGNDEAVSLVGKPKQPDLFAAISDFKTIKDTAHNYMLLQTDEEIDNFLKQAIVKKEISFDTETTSIHPREAELVGMSFCWKKHEAFYLPLPAEREKVINIVENFRPLFEMKEMKWIGHNLKYDLIILKNYGFDLTGKYFDTMLAHYAIAPEGKKNMELLSQQYLQYQPIGIESLIGKKGKNQGNMRDVPIEISKDYACEDADVTLQLKEIIEPILITEEVKDLFDFVENPLGAVLADMEFLGIRLDKQFLNNYAEELNLQIKKAEASTYEKAGVTFNLASPKQLGEVLFDKLKLDEKAKKTKTGQYATGEDILQKLRQKDPIIEDILTFRTLSKLKSTYADALPLLIHPETGRVHTTFNQALVSTGRLSSNNPNLQNIPIKTESGREIRKAFIAIDDDHVLLSADYSQIELRIVAAISGDQNMIQAFQEHRDIHRATAAKVYGVTEDDVDSDMRRNAKAVNFGIIYGQSAFGLSENLGISRYEAKEIIENYFREYHSVKKYMDDSIGFAKKHGYVQTIKGRRIKLPDINSSNHTVRGFAERLAINAPIQGSAADMIKLAMIKISARLKNESLKSKMILQVHDELIFDVPKEELDLVQKIVKEEMESAIVLDNDVPVVAETGYGRNWLDAH